MLAAGCAVLILFWPILRRLVHSPFGLSLSGIREQTKRMPALGANVSRRLVAVFTLGAAVAGVAGALLAQTTQFVGMETLSFSRSAELLIMLVLGGTGRLYGGLVGAALFMLMPRLSIRLESQLYWQFWIGLLLVLIVMCARGGVLGVAGAVAAVTDALPGVPASSAYGGLIVSSALRTGRPCPSDWGGFKANDELSLSPFSAAHCHAMF